MVWRSCGPARAGWVPIVLRRTPACHVPATVGFSPYICCNETKSCPMQSDHMLCKQCHIQCYYTWVLTYNQWSQVELEHVEDWPKSNSTRSQVLVLVLNRSEWSYVLSCFLTKNAINLAPNVWVFLIRLWLACTGLPCSDCTAPILTTWTTTLTKYNKYLEQIRKKVSCQLNYHYNVNFEYPLLQHTLWKAC